MVAAAVVLKAPIPGLNDSKKLNEKQRNSLAELIKSEALAYHIAFVDERKIDEINILKASILAMHLALDGLRIRPEYIIVDGNKFTPYERVPHACVVKGDGIYQSIAAASILAKTARDAYMKEMHEIYPQYQWHANKGYPTISHVNAIKNFGICSLHRQTFGIVREICQRRLFD